MNVLWPVFSGRRNVKPRIRNLRRKPNHEDMKIILKEGVEKYGCKGRGFVHDISRLMKKFKDQ